MRYVIACFIGSVVCLLTLSALAATVEVEPHSSWKFIAKADAIVVGRLSASPRVKKALQKTSPAEEFVQIDLEVTRTLKGPLSARIPVRHYVSSQPDYGPAAKDMFDLLGQSSLIYLIYSEGEYYFSYGKEAISPVEKLPKDEIQSVMQELVRQKTVLDNWEPLEKSPHYSDIKILIDAIAEGNESALIVLEEIGVKAVPAIVSLLDDKRPYPYRQLPLRNKSLDDFEAYRRYGPELMVDALAAILNQITGVSFGFIFNGASEIERQHEIDGWRIYVMTEPTFKATVK